MCVCGTCSEGGLDDARGGNSHAELRDGFLFVVRQHICYSFIGYVSYSFIGYVSCSFLIGEYSFIICVLFIKLPYFYISNFFYILTLRVTVGPLASSCSVLLNNALRTELQQIILGRQDKTR